MIIWFELFEKSEISAKRAVKLLIRLQIVIKFIKDK